MMDERAISYMEVTEVGLKEVTSGFLWLIKVARENPAQPSALLALPRMNMLEHGTAQVLGRIASATLAAGEAYSIVNVLTLTLMTERKPKDSWSGPLLVLFPTRKLLDMIDRMSGVSKILVVTRHLRTVRLWLDARSATPLEPSPALLKRKSVSPVIDAALRTLSLKVKHLGGPSQPSALGAMVSLFDALLRLGFSFEPKSVRTWLIEIGEWSPADADRAAEIAERVRTGVRPCAEAFVWSKRILEAWLAVGRIDARRAVLEGSAP